MNLPQPPLPPPPPGAASPPSGPGGEGAADTGATKATPGPTVPSNAVQRRKARRKKRTPAAEGPGTADQKLTHLVIDSGAIIKGAGMTLASAAEVRRGVLVRVIIDPICGGGRIGGGGRRRHLLRFIGSPDRRGVAS